VDQGRFRRPAFQYGMSCDPPSHLPHATERSARPCVVVVENDRALLNALQFSLEVEGYDVQPFSNPTELLAREGSVSTAACLVIDYRLSSLDGLQLFALLQSHGLTAPAILMTSQPDDHCRREALRLGIEIVEKPLLTDALSRRIRAFVAAQSVH
jgi:two-component system response regulator FixJ